MTRVQIKKAQLEVIEKLLNTLSDMRRDATQDYRVIGKEDKQATNWKTGELLWEDEEKTIPRYDNKWGYVPLTGEEMTDDKKALLQAIEDMEKSLDKMV